MGVQPPVARVQGQTVAPLLFLRRLKMVSQLVPNDAATKLFLCISMFLPSVPVFVTCYVEHGLKMQPVQGFAFCLSPEEHILFLYARAVHIASAIALHLVPSTAHVGSLIVGSPLIRGTAFLPRHSEAAVGRPRHLPGGAGPRPALRRMAGVGGCLGQPRLASHAGRHWCVPPVGTQVDWYWTGQQAKQMGIACNSRIIICTCMASFTPSFNPSHADMNMHKHINIKYK